MWDQRKMTQQEEENKHKTMILNNLLTFYTSDYKVMSLLGL